MAGRLINHGFPITKDEIREAQKRHRQGDDLEQLEEYFQRSRMSISDMLERYLPERLTIKEALTNPLDKLLLCENCNCFWYADQIDVHCPDCNWVCKTVAKVKPKKTRVSKLKVFGGTILTAEKAEARAIVACKSKKKAAAIIDISLAQFNQAWCESGDINELSIGTQSPGVIFIASSDDPTGFAPAN